MQAVSSWDVIVIGGGHAGCEAADAAFRLGCRVALITLRQDCIGMMSCNPAIGGLAKSQLVKEVDALGGAMGVVTDRSAIQYRLLNESKGPAVQATRAQCDKKRYAQNMQAFLKELPLDLIEAEISQVLVENGKVKGVVDKKDNIYRASAVIITSGTFMRGILHTGEEQEAGGRRGEPPSVGLSAHLLDLGFRVRRLKTGTPPRLHRRSIDWDLLEEQKPMENPKAFSFFRKPNPFPSLRQISCFITYTNEQTHQIIGNSIHRSPMFTGAITGVGPRYCPSIEDKIFRFKDKKRHQVFLEPEGLDVDEVYVNGVSTSLPKDVQEQFIKSIHGLHRAEFIRYGYAVEYDAIDARQLKATFESKEISGLFFAGQVNGTSGYEEAAAQGIIAGINAGLGVKEKEPWIFSRRDGYLGVLADDLVLKGSNEPYRMFTSRAEYRLNLREDNADLRLSEKASELGLLDSKSAETFARKRDLIFKMREKLARSYQKPSESINGRLQERGFSPLKDRVSLEDLLRRPEMKMEDLEFLAPEVFSEEFSGGFCEELKKEILQQVEIQIRYAGYIQRDQLIFESIRKSEDMRIPLETDFSRIPGLSNEIKGLLGQIHPENLGQMARIPGVTPAAVANMMIFLQMKKKGHSFSIPSLTSHPRGSS